MTSRQARTERRAAERKARKAEMKRQKAAALSGFVSQNAPEPSRLNEAALFSEPKIQNNEAALFSEPKIQNNEAALLSEPKTQSSTPTRRAEINRENAQHSTGPTSSAGKLASSRNSLQHGLASGTVIIPGEDPAQFEALLNDLLAEHQPATPTEELLVQEMAQSHWLAQRALHLQNDCFSENGIDEKRLALFLRYQTTHQRAFHKALTALLKLQKERARATKSGFVSQSLARSIPEIGFVSQNALDDADFRTPTVSEEASEDGFVSQNRYSEAA